MRVCINAARACDREYSTKRSVRSVLVGMPIHHGKPPIAAKCGPMYVTWKQRTMIENGSRLQVSRLVTKNDPITLKLDTNGRNSTPTNCRYRYIISGTIVQTDAGTKSEKF